MILMLMTIYYYNNAAGINVGPFVVMKMIVVKMTQFVQQLPECTTNNINRLTPVICRRGIKRKNIFTWSK